MQFIKCSCDVLEKDRSKIIRRHMSAKQKQKLAKQRRENYSSMDPVGSITSRCLGNEPALLPRRHGWTREDSFVSLSQSDYRPQIFVGHTSVHKLSRQIIVNKMADDVELMALAR